MEAKGWMTLNALIQHYHGGSQEFLNFLSDEDRAELENHSVELNGSLSSLVVDPIEGLRRIHYSWIAPVINDADKSMQPYFFSVLGPKRQQRVATLLQKKQKPISLSQPVRFFLAAELYKRIIDENVLPLPFVPTTELSPLLDLKNKELIDLIDLLGIHDLAAEFKTIIDPKIMNNVYNHLTPKKQDYLKELVRHGKEKPKGDLPLSAATKESDKFLRLLHHRGIARLGRALHDSTPDFLWYLKHNLDSGRADLLTKYISKEETPETVSAMTSQVIETLRFLKQ